MNTLSWRPVSAVDLEQELNSWSRWMLLITSLNDHSGVRYQCGQHNVNLRQVPAQVNG